MVAHPLLKDRGGIGHISILLLRQQMMCESLLCLRLDLDMIKIIVLNQIPG